MAGQEPTERLDAAIDDHRVVGSGSGSDPADGRIMIKMDPALLKGQAWRQPPLVGTRPGTEIDDLQDAVGDRGPRSDS